MLTKIAYRWEHLPLVAAFACGDEPWERYIANYLKSTEATGALAEAERYENDAWLYFSEHRELVGYAVLGLTKWKWPNPGKRQEHLHAVALGVDQRFQHQPPGPREGRYSWLLATDVIAEASRRAGASPLLTLFVHERNTKAIKFYDNLKFIRVPEVDYTDPATRAKHLGMVLRPPEAPGNPPSAAPEYRP